MSGWYAVLLSDPTAEKECVTVPTTQTLPEGNDGGSSTPLKAGGDPLFLCDPEGSEDEEEDFGWSLKRFPLWGEQGGTFNPGSALKALKNTATWPIFPLWGEHGGSFSLSKTLLFGTQGFGDPGWSLPPRNEAPLVLAHDGGKEGASWL
jgi:hypothetical protein